MTPEDLLRAYETALATQEWERVEPLMHADACVTFSNGKQFRGRDEVEGAFRQNFSLIQDERYTISDVHWLAREPSYATCTYQFHWSGLIEGKPAQGAGRGTSVMKNEGGTWFVLAEHLGPLA
ncbi:MAG: nuclear transport factor 2 family protein [Actinobacteria bacterium]|nr:nuclear transport factor 2 family protein [Actinomycetota bacterium]